VSLLTFVITKTTPMIKLLQNLNISLFILSFLFFSSEGIAQKNITAHQVSSSIEIDGTLSEADWKQHLQNGNFIQITPENGAPSLRKTEVAVLYNNTYLYVAAVLYIEGTTELNKQLTARDD